MIYNLDRADIKNLLRGISFPPYEMLEELQKRKLGHYTEAFMTDGLGTYIIQRNQIRNYLNYI